MIQHQHWKESIRILITDEQHHGSVQAFIPNLNEDKPLDGEADALIYSLWVDEAHRGREVAKHLMEAVERELKRCGIEPSQYRGTDATLPYGCCTGIKSWVSKKRRSAINAARF